MEREDESDEGVGTPPYRQHFTASASTDPLADEDEGEGDAEEEEEEEDTLNSSTSTAGPQGGARRTGRYNSHPWESPGSATSGSSPGSSTQRVYQRGAAFKRTGSYRAIPSGNKHSSGNRRSLSNASTVASLMGSVPEWGRSFCLISPARGVAASRHSIHWGQQILTSGIHTHASGGVSSPSSSSPAGHGVGTGSHALDHHRPSVSFNMSLSFGGMGNNEGGRSASVLFSAAQLHSPISTASPLLGSHWGGGRQSMIISTPSSPTKAAYYAMGGAAGIFSRGNVGSISDARRELPMLLRTLCSYLCLTGKPIISGNIDHPMDIRKGPLIGTGGFAKVYAGVDGVSGKLVAIKEINIAEVNDHDALNAIGKEFGILKSLRHPNIVSYQLFEHSASQKVCRIVMELLTGGSTQILLEKYGTLREPILRKFARHLLEGIAYIHKEGISHRDIKPANILVSHDGVVKLCDFGCSKRVNELNKSSSCIIGTPLYMAPEFIKGEANHKSDIWSMACSLFELGTGLLPWYHAGVRDNLPLMFYITTSSETPLVIPPQDDVPEFSVEFMDFMEKCFTRRVDQRPEAVELLKHPWITGARVSPPDVSLSIYSGSQSPSRQSIQSPINEDLLCQQELEDVSAYISNELCVTWMTGHSMLTSLSPLIQHNVDIQGNNEDVMQRPLERRLLDSQIGIINSRCESPAVSSRGGGTISGTGIPVSPTISQDAALHENFNYTVPLGSSAGCFILPQTHSPAPASVMPQYLRINADGSLDFANADDDEDEDMVEVEVDADADVDDAFASSYRHQFNRSPSFNLAFSSSPNNVIGNNGIVGNMVLPSSSSQSNSQGFSNSNNNNNNHSATSFGWSPAGRNTRHISVVQSHSLSLMSSSSFASRGVSPSRRSAAASTASLTTSQQLPCLLPAGGSTSLPPMTSVNHSSGDATPDNHGGAPSSSNISKFLDNFKHETNGRLRMSLSVPSGGPDRRVNIELSIDPGDVRSKIIERRPSYVVVLSEDVKTQLAAKMQELASSGASSPLEGSHVKGGIVDPSRRRFSRSAQGGSSLSVSPNCVSPSISPARRSLGGGGGGGGGAFAGCSPRQRRGGGGGWGMRGSSHTNNSSPAGSCVSATHSSSNGDGRTPPYS